jgi:hypothetical protein
VLALVGLSTVAAVTPTQEAAAASFSACARASYTVGDSQACGKGSYEPLLEGQGLDVKAVVSSSVDGENTTQREVAAAAAYGSDLSGQGRVLGLGIEPMADVRGLVELTSVSSYAQAGILSNASASVRHRVSAIVGTPDGIADGPVSLLLAWALHLSRELTGPETGWIDNFSAQFIVSGSSVSGQRALSESVDQTDTNWDPSGVSVYLAHTRDDITITATAGVSLNFRYPAPALTSLYAQAVADPFLYVDPTWEYARYFVVEQESLLKPGTWVPVTRDWRSTQPVPEPASWLLLATGIAALTWRESIGRTRPAPFRSSPVQG